MRSRSRALRVLRWGGVALAVLAGALWGWVAVQDMRLERAFEEMLSAAPARPDAVSSGANGDGARPTTLRLSLVTYNVWALPVALPGMDRLGRLPRIPPALAAFGTDLILLQEAFDIRMKAFVAESLEGYRAGPDFLCREPMVPVGEKDCTGGLVTLSRWPVTEERFYAHPVGEGAKFDEANGRKGFMLTTVETELGPMDVVNIHLYAGRTAADEAQRLLQLAQLRDVVGRAREAERPVLLVGDLNVVHPSLSARDTSLAASDAYRFVVDSLGFVATHPEADEGDLTYDIVTNRYANLWYNRFEGRQVFDYVMLRVPEGMAFEVVERRRVLDGADPLSDHYGAYAVLELRSVGARN